MFYSIYSIFICHSNASTRSLTQTHVFHFFPFLLFLHEVCSLFNWIYFQIPHDKSTDWFVPIPIPFSFTLFPHTMPDSVVQCSRLILFRTFIICSSQSHTILKWYHHSFSFVSLILWYHVVIYWYCIIYNIIRFYIRFFN